MRSILSLEDRNRYRAMCSWRKRNNQQIPTEAEYKAYRNSPDAGKHKSIGIDKKKGTKENRDRYKESSKKGAKKSKRRRAREKIENKEESFFTESAKVIVERIKDRAKSMTTPKAQSESWRI